MVTLVTLLGFSFAFWVIMNKGNLPEGLSYNWLCSWINISLLHRRQLIIFNLHYFSFQGRGLQHPPSLDWVCGSGYWDGLQLSLPWSDRLHHWHHGADLQGSERQVRERFIQGRGFDFDSFVVSVAFKLDVSNGGNCTKNRPKLHAQNFKVYSTQEVNFDSLHS